MARDIRKDWSLVGYEFNRDIEYHKLKVEMERQEKNANPEKDPRSVFTESEYWDEIMPDTGGTMGGEMATISCFVGQLPIFRDQIAASK